MTDERKSTTFHEAQTVFEAAIFLAKRNHSHLLANLEANITKGQIPENAVSTFSFITLAIVAHEALLTTMSAMDKASRTEFGDMLMTYIKRHAYELYGALSTQDKVDQIAQTGFTREEAVELVANSDCAKLSEIGERQHKELICELLIQLLPEDEAEDLRRELDMRPGQPLH